MVTLAVWPGINANLRQCPIVIPRIVLRTTALVILLLTVLAAIRRSIILAVGSIDVLVMRNDACSCVMGWVPVTVSMGVGIARDPSMKPIMRRVVLRIPIRAILVITVHGNCRCVGKLFTSSVVLDNAPIFRY